MVTDSPWQNKNVFITGCTGLLGSHLTRRLCDAGANVVGLIRDWLPEAELIRAGTLSKMRVVRGAVEDYSLLERVVNEYEVGHVFHLAAQTIVGIANNNPLSTFETNVKGTWNLLEACRRNGVKGVIVASSDKAYGAHEQLPYMENAPLKGTHPYDVSKSCADLISQAYHETYGLPVCVSRCGNLFGGGDLNFNRLIPGTIRSVIFNERPVIRSDGKFIRDYIYVEDAVNALLLLSERMTDSKFHGEAFNFSNEIQLTAIELVDRILKIMERPDLQPTIANTATGEIMHQYLSANKAREWLEWRAEYGIENGLLRTVPWYQEFFR